MFEKISAIFTAISSKPLAGFLSTECPCLVAKKLFFFDRMVKHARWNRDRVTYLSMHSRYASVFSHVLAYDGKEEDKWLYNDTDDR